MMKRLDRSDCEKIKRIKNEVRAMLEERPDGYKSSLENLACEKFEYLMGLDEQYFAQLRYHTYYFDSDNYLGYFAGLYETRDLARWKSLTEGIPRWLVLSDPSSIEHMGYTWGEYLISQNTMRFQGIVNTLYREGILDELKKRKHIKVMEIGAGYGGLIYNLQKILPDVAIEFTIVDLPETLLFSKSYLALTANTEKIKFLPNYKFNTLRDQYDLVLNIATFQQLTKEQLDMYLDFIQKNLRGWLYSQNVDRYRLNPSPINVSEELKKRFSVKEIHQKRDAKRIAKDLIKKYILRRLPPGYHEYICTTKS